jgi:hypothetical protein
MSDARPVPNQTMIWKPAEAQRAQARQIHEEEPGWESAGCLKHSKKGDRAVVYISGGDRGVYGYFDFGTDAMPHHELRYAGWGRFVWLEQHIPPGAIEDRDGPILRLVRRPNRLSQDQQDRLQATIGRFPKRAEMPAQPSPTDADWVWFPAGAAWDWGSERAMQLAIAGDEPSWRKLEFTAPPKCEQQVVHGLRRTDLWEPGVIAECKIVADRATLDQVHGYLAAYRSSHPEIQWRGHIIAARGYSRILAKDAIRAGVGLWLCERESGATPHLMSITDPDAEPPKGRLTLFRAAEDGLDYILEAATELAIQAGLSEDRAEQIVKTDPDELDQKLPEEPPPEKGKNVEWWLSAACVMCATNSERLADIAESIGIDRARYAAGTNPDDR